MRPGEDRRFLGRRDFLRLVALGAGSSSLALTWACTTAPPAAAPTTAAAAPTSPPSAAGAPTAAATPAAKPTTAPASQATSAPKPGAAPTGEIAILQGVDAESLDPMVTTSSASRSMIYGMFDALVRKNAQMQIEPALAVSWETPNGTTWRFKLRQGVKFHDGSPFNAEAATFTLQRYVDPNTKNPQAALLKPVTAVKALDDSTIELTTDGPYAAMLLALYDAVMMSPSAVKAAGDAVAKKPVGTGPYRFVEWVPGERLVMEANPDYWGDKAKLQRITWKPVPEASTRVVALRTGDADLIGGVPPQLEAQVNEPEAKLAKVPGIMMTVMFNAAKKPFDDTRVRQAINYAVNVDEIIQFVMGGAGYRLASATKAGMLGYDPNLKPYAYDPEKAKQLLADAGYANGFEATFDGPSGRYINDRAVSEAIVGQLTKIGLKITPNVVEWNAFVQKVIKQESQFFLIAQVDPTSEIAFPRTYLPGGALYQNYQNKDVADLIQRGNGTLDPVERDKIFRQANQLLHDDPPWLFLYAQQDVYGLRSRVQGFEPRTDSFIIPGPLSVSA